MGSQKPQLNDQKVIDLRKSLGHLLVSLKVTPNTKRWADLILTFYTGAYGTPDKIPPYAAVCMMSGRQSDLYILPEGVSLPTSTLRGVK